MSNRERATILVVDDEKTVADTYAHRLATRYETEAAYGGKEALEKLDELDADLVMLDRRMPDLTGDEVLERIRDRDEDCRVVMVTAVDPGFETIDMPFDDYICKPIEQEPLLTAVEQQLRVLALDKLGEYFELLSKRQIVTASTTPSERDANAEYQELVDRCEELDEDLSAHLDMFDDLSEAFQRVDREP